MDTNQTVHAALTSGAARFEAFEAAAGTQVHELMDKLKVIYEKFHGAVGLDKLDWHWQATALKNHITANGEPNAHADATAANSANTPRPGSNPDTDADAEKSSTPLEPVVLHEEPAPHTETVDPLPTPIESAAPAPVDEVAHVDPPKTE